MGYDNNECIKKLEKSGCTPVCDKISASMSHHCSSFMISEAYHKACIDKDVYMPVMSWYCMNTDTKEARYFDPSVIMKECMKLSMKDPAWTCDTCYCCCACFAEHTMVETAKGAKQIREIKKGEELKVGSPAEPGNTACVWETAPVVFAEGSEGGIHEGMLYIIFGSKKEIIVTPDHVFLLSTGRFIQAGKLKPGDELVDEKGNPQPVLTASMGRYEGGVRHISCNTDFDGKPDHHLVISEGIISGDYTLQLFYDSLSDEWKEEGQEDRLLVGSHTFLKKYKNKMLGNITFFAGPQENNQNKDLTENQQAHPEYFKVYDFHDLVHSVNYQYAAKFLTEAQAAEIFEKSAMSPMSDGIKHGFAQYAVSLLRGFYPDLEILLDWQHLSPNVYSFVLFGKKYVVLSGGLARVPEMNVEGLVFAVSQGIARYYGRNGKCGEKMCSTGLADFYAAAVVSRNVYYGRIWGDAAKETVRQIGKLFSYAIQEDTEENKKENEERRTRENTEENTRENAEENRKQKISLECRMDTIFAGFGGGDLPVCAGGKAHPDLKLQSLEAKTDQIELIFNLDLETDTALEKEHYQIEGAEIIEVVADEKEHFRIRLKTKLEEGASYQLVLEGLVSVYDTQLDEKSRRTEFSV